ncbi:copper chaperone PCu(A)C [Actimicrobium sp. CCC2.4]|uniref:copper chaperone PCu(A)C n=1 Tax=Actimicrobium sp. CCC2.4 TaxID=3048606 RepID=UPI002AC9E67B|nr:copper chaperone PCu(A)C [Actimicrobium sp. CCC2.4]MEB0134252.1 copper chaperone PCu(A)C [Actimicrobium sp. CCC2.4]WPX32900.1 copper chaperone PCu(A)C [Actimicrobium sp. CCC2.4]
MRLTTLIFFAATGIAASAFAAGAAIEVSRAVARASAPGQPSAAVYLTIRNSSASADKLLRIATPVAAAAELHTMSMTGNVMKMREVSGIAIAANSTLTMAAGDGYHVMLTGLKQPLVAGMPVPLRLTFEKAGTVDALVDVGALTAAH